MKIIYQWLAGEDSKCWYKNSQPLIMINEISVRYSIGSLDLREHKYTQYVETLKIVI